MHCMHDEITTCFSCPAQTCSDPNYVVMSVGMCVTFMLPIIRRSTSPIPIGCGGISRRFCLVESVDKQEKLPWI